MTLTIKICFVIIEDCVNFFLAILNIDIFYEKKEALTLLAFFYYLSLNFSTPESNNWIYNKFILIVVKNKAVYTLVTKVKEM